MTWIVWALAAATADAALAQSQTFSLNEGREWVLETAPEPNSDEWIISEARRLIADGQLARAERNLSQWLDAPLHEASPLRAEALIARA
ncbi:MAG: hypothetical protein KDE45_17340, partial [Caldilineaceae bacterium]|nr:hypothetical protein [Caldilineaceae bacterium]